MKRAARFTPAAMWIRLLLETQTAVCCYYELLGADDPGDSLEIASVSLKTSVVLVIAVAADVTG